VLAGELSLSEALHDYALDGAMEGHLLVLPAGHPPPNPSALLSSARAVEMLRELGAENDLVIIDTPAALAVSDPVPLMRHVSGIVMVARMNRSSRQTMRRLRKIIDQAHGNLLGVVATGVSAGPGYEHYHPTYYATSNGTNGSSKSRFSIGRRKADGVGRPESPTLERPGVEHTD
jgi:Mrp family chromosome partitioning ATPase